MKLNTYVIHWDDINIHRNVFWACSSEQDGTNVNCSHSNWYRMNGHPKISWHRAHSGWRRRKQNLCMCNTFSIKNLQYNADIY